jgi:hypothetical protein
MRPGGNPELKKYQFKQKYDWDEPCNEKMTIRLPSSLKQAIKAGLIEDWQEVARRAIAAELEKEKKKQKKNLRIAKPRANRTTGCI